MASTSSIERQGTPTIFPIPVTPVPRNIPRQVRDEIIQEVALGIWEGNYKLVNVREAVKHASRAVNRLYPTLGAPLSLDAPVFGGGLPLIERVSEGLW